MNSLLVKELGRTHICEHDSLKTEQSFVTKLEIYGVIKHNHHENIYIKVGSQ